MPVLELVCLSSWEEQQKLLALWLSSLLCPRNSICLGVVLLLQCLAVRAKRTHIVWEQRGLAALEGQQCLRELVGGLVLRSEAQQHCCWALVLSSQLPGSFFLPSIMKLLSLDPGGARARLSWSSVISYTALWHLFFWLVLLCFLLLLFFCSSFFTACLLLGITSLVNALYRILHL